MTQTLQVTFRGNDWIELMPDRDDKLRELASVLLHFDQPPPDELAVGKHFLFMLLDS